MLQLDQYVQWNRRKLSWHYHSTLGEKTLLCKSRQGSQPTRSFLKPLLTTNDRPTLSLRRTRAQSIHNFKAVFCLGPTLSFEASIMHFGSMNNWTHENRDTARIMSSLNVIHPSWYCSLVRSRIKGDPKKTKKIHPFPAHQTNFCSGYQNKAKRVEAQVRTYVLRTTWK